VRNHAVADAAAGETFGLGAAKDAQDVVLRARKTMGLEELLGFEAERVGGLLERNEDAIFDGKSGTRWGPATHEATIVVMTTSVKRKIIRLGGLALRVCERASAESR
jgi:hypothetical protein